ncbi:MAG: DUF131 domain-containing protein [Desulfurococcaceae archaeon]|nr:DUF131 domain-containing protein [Desulfurococcaceae archaeon]
MFALLLVSAFIIILLGMLLIVFSMLKETEHGEKKVEGGGVLIIGPLPIIIGTSERITKALIILALVLLIFSLLVFLTFTGYLKW